MLEAEFSDGTTAIDSTSLTVRGRYTVITARDTANAGQLILVPPHEPVFGREGRAGIRVVSAFTGGSVRVSVGARTDPDEANGYISGQTLTAQIGFDEVSGITLLNPGVVPITVATDRTPTALLATRQVNLESNKDYLVDACR